MKKTIIARTFFVISMLLVPMSAFGHSHFYRAAQYREEPRRDKNNLTSIDVSVMGGRTSHGRNADKDKVDALNIYGLHEMRKLGEGMTGLNPLNALDNILLTLRDKAANGNFGKLLFTGKVKFVGAEIAWTQNFCNGFFSQIIIPVNRLAVSDVAFTDQSPTTGIPNVTDADWLQFLSNFTNIMTRYNLSASDVSQTSIGDIETYIGWTFNNESSDVLDFLDTTIKVGALYPSAKQHDTAQAFSVATGYEHVGIATSFDIALGLYEWFTWGAHVGGLFFLKNTQEFRMKTFADQNGFIKLARGAAERDLGNIFDTGTYIKADHIAGGFSLMLGYTYRSQEDSTLTPTDTVRFTSTIVNSDEMLKKWNMHNLHVIAEYDFAKEGHSWNPKISLSYDQPLAGKRIFNTAMIGGNAGLNITWNF